MVHSTSINSEPQTIPTKVGKQLPNTGESASVSSALLGAVAGLTGLGLVAKRRKNDNEE
ncbi:Gram positive anchor [Streptococcus mitis]|uniref:Gram positive anchor n=2 Tax=Streptococcus mitis TaxID=28037 RepID=A0A428DGS9_STRMT|nr:Gram positive anchor [Streptococcus mitis]